MPELPEVRTVANFLKKEVIGLKIISVDVFTPKLIWRNNNDEFCQTIIKKTIKDVFNYGKYLIFNLGDFTMVSHLRMEGKWSVSDKSVYIYPKSHLSIEFQLSNNKYLRYYDSRKFGTLELWPSSEYLKKSGIDKLGPEPINDMLEFDYVKNLVMKKSIKIKPFLMDQSIICGIGNIYANEILFAAKIAPDRITKSLSDKDIKNIIRESNDILSSAIKAKGSSIHSYKSADGQQGEYQNYLKVHLRENKPCLVCHNLIIKAKIGGRGTYFCPSCQK